LSLKVKAFIIHLSRARSRRPQVEALSQSLPIPAEVIPAIDSEQLADDEIEAVYWRRLHKPVYPFRLTTCEIACFLSHRKAWQAIVDHKLDAGFVAEDDIALTADFADVFILASQHLTRKSFFRFSYHVRETGPVVARSGHIRLIRPIPVGLRQGAQLIGHEAAKQLLEATRYFDRPVDTMSQLFWITGVRPFSLLPGGVIEISDKLGGSTFKKQRKLAEKLYREVMRPLYRAQTAALSRKND